MIKNIKNSQPNALFILGTAEKMKDYLLSKKIDLIPCNIFIPDNLINEIELFSKRNIIKIDEKRGTCCPSCLKAHIISFANEIGLPKESIDYIKNLFPYETGHNGYYMDQDKIKRIDY